MEKKDTGDAKKLGGERIIGGKILEELEKLAKGQGADAASCLDKCVLAPLGKIQPPNAADGPLLLVVDSLDESLKVEGKSIARLLADKLAQFPSWLRVLATSRPEVAAVAF